ncbi:MAG: hypothetical protein RLZ04_359 [Actinomycetota bacterium]
MLDSDSLPVHTPPVAAYLVGFVFIGIALSTAGPALSALRDGVGTDDAGIALLFVGSSVGYVAGSFLAGRLLDAGHGHGAWTAAMWIAVAAMLGVAAAPSLFLLVVAFGVLGFVCGLSDVCGNTLVIWSRPSGSSALLNALHMMFAVGAMLAPILVNRSLAWFDSVWGVTVPMAAIAAWCTWMLSTHEAPQKSRTVAAAPTDGSVGRSGERGVLVAAVCVFFFSYVALETGFAGWIHTYVEQIGYGDATTATGVITTFWVGFTLGRVLSIPLARRVQPGTIVGAAMALSVLASVLFWAARDGGPMLWVVTFLFAVSIAPQYASMMAFAEQHLALSGGNTAAIIACSGIGGLVLPWLLGQLFDAIGPEALPPTITIVAVVTTVVAAVTGRLLLASDRRAS